MPYTFSVATGMLPPGLVLNPSTGEISGIPVTAGTYEFVISVEDSDGCIAAMPYILIINCPDISFETSSPLQSGTAGSSYSRTIEISGGVMPYTFSVATGMLPPGLVLNPTTGEISGIPVTAGTYEFVISVEDSDGCIAAMPYILIINCPDISFETSSPLPSGTAGSSYSRTIEISGGVMPYTFSVATGMLPPGVVLNPTTGEISGIPTTAGTYEFVISVEDSDGCIAAMPYILIINCPDISFETSSPLDSGTAGSSYSRTIELRNKPICPEFSSVWFHYKERN